MMNGKEARRLTTQVAELIERSLQDLETALAAEGFHVKGVDVDIKKLQPFGPPVAEDGPRIITVGIAISA